MPKWCVVPTCKTGSRSEPSKHSVFRVPRDIVRRKQWENAIPGIVKLNPTNVVCDNHFNVEDILYEWKKEDADGRIIARVRYQRPRLRDAAVPTRFNCGTSRTETDIEHSYFIREPAQKLSLQRNNIGLENCTPNIDNNCTIVSSTSISEASDSRTDKIELSSSIMESVVACEVICPASPVEYFKGKEEILFTENSDSKIGETEPSSSTTETLPICESILPTPSPITTNIIEKANIIGEGEKLDLSELSVGVPEPWTCHRVFAGGVHRMVFSYIVLLLRNGEYCPVTLKNVVLDEKRVLKYYAYGILVDSDKLAGVLKNKETLPLVLGKFMYMNICNGVGDLDVHLILANGGYSDSSLKWRSKNCSLTCPKKKCESCVKSRKCILQRLTRMKNAPTVKRIRGALNSVDQRKLLAMQMKIKLERSQRTRAQEQIKSMVTDVQAHKHK